jgi:hypothetical protein
VGRRTNTKWELDGQVRVGSTVVGGGEDGKVSRQSKVSKEIVPDGCPVFGQKQLRKPLVNHGIS